MFRRVELFETESGKCPVGDYLAETLRMRHERAKIVKVLEAVETVQQLPSTVLKKLSGRDNLWEIKVGSHRLLGFFHRRDLLVLVHAFTKKTRKTPPQDIELALVRQRRYAAQYP